VFQTSVPATAAAFFDRSAELGRLDHILGRHREVPEWLAIVGSRKVGKTSLLLEWERRVADPALVCVVTDVLEAAPLSREWFRICALHVVDRVLGSDAGAGLAELAGRPAEYRIALQRSQRFAALPPAVRGEVLELPERKLDGPALVACLDLPEQLATALKLRIVLAIDEFQELAGLESRPRIDPFAIMRSAWQRHRHVAYVISGSARTMLTELVSSERSPFFQHFSLMELGPLGRDDGIALLVESAPADRPIPRELAGRAVDIMGGHPFYLQLLGETMTALGAPVDEVALREALGQLVFTRTGRLALYFENEYRRAVGKAASLAAVLSVIAAEPRRPGEVAAALGAASGAVASYIDRLRDVIVRDDADRWRVADPVFGLWLRWRVPGGAAVPMTVVGDEAERLVAEALAHLGFDLVYQSRASRGAFDLLATRGAQQLGVQVKRAAIPLRLPAAQWKRMQAEAVRLGWRAVIAVVTPDHAVEFLDLAKARISGRTGSLGASAAIDNLLLWLDRPASPRRPRP
jgi:AAA+ ATPase superfamily predicted ATPase